MKHVTTKCDRCYREMEEGESGEVMFDFGRTSWEVDFCGACLLEIVQNEVRKKPPQAKKEFFVELTGREEY